MEQVSEIEVHLPHASLPDADWADGYSIHITEVFADAREAGEAIIAAFPKWTYLMLAVRQLVVSPFGLKGAGHLEGADRLGIFPVVSQTDDQVVAGLNDNHLDFRIIVDVSRGVEPQRVSLTTVIKRHNWLGRNYLQLVLPFHRAIIRGALKRVAASRN